MVDAFGVCGHPSDSSFTDCAAPSVQGFWFTTSTMASVGLFHATLFTTKSAAPAKKCAVQL